MTRINFLLFRFLDPTDFPVNGYLSENRNEKPDGLFHGFSFHVTNSVLPPKHQMQVIIESAGGTLTSRMHNLRTLNDSDTNSDTKVVIATASDRRRCDSALKAGIPVVANEFVLSGILNQEVDFYSHSLFSLEPKDEDSKKKSFFKKPSTVLDETVSSSKRAPASKATRSSTRYRKKK